MYRAQGISDGLSGSALDDFVDDAITTMNNSLTTQYHSLHTEFAAYARGTYSAGDLTTWQGSTSDDYLVTMADYVAGFEYELSAEQTAQLTGSIKIWTEEELLFTIGAGLLVEVTDTQTTIESDNIVGANVTIVVSGGAGSGNIGSFGTPVTIDVRPRPLNLTTEERIQLASAERADVIFISGTKYSGLVTFAADPVNGDTLTRASGNWADNGFAAGLYIRVEGTTGNTTPSRVFWEIDSVAGNVLRLKRKGQTTAESNRSVVVTPVVLDPSAPGAVVTFIEIAQRDDIDLNAAAMFLPAGQALFSLAPSRPSGYFRFLLVDASIKSGGSITNTAADTSTVVITADDLVLEAADGPIGSDTKPMLINIVSGLTARAKNDVVITEAAVR